MKVILLDAKEYAKVEGHTFLHELCSFHVKKFTSAADEWRNWCPVSQFKVDADGQVYGRITSETVPTGVYNGTVLETKYARLERTLDKYMQEVQ